MGTVLYFIVITLFIFLAALLCFVILIQEGKTSGFGSSFGGDATESLFGTSTADVLKKFTAYLAAAFLIGCVLLSFWTSALGRSKVTHTSPFNVEQPEIEG